MIIITTPHILSVACLLSHLWINVSLYTTKCSCSFAVDICQKYMLNYHNFIIVLFSTLNIQIILPSTLIFPYVLLHGGTLIRGSIFIVLSVKKRGYTYYAMDFFPTGTLIWAVLLFGC